MATDKKPAQAKKTLQTKPKRRAKSAKDKNKAAVNPALALSPDDFAYLVAGLAWREGLTANAIARRLGLEPKPEHLMRVKRGLSRAHDRYLKLVPPEDRKVKQDLEEFVNRSRARRIEFTVVNDKLGPSGAVCAKAADVIAEIIRDAVHQPPSQEAPPSDSQDAPAPDVVICNAGGGTVSATVQALVRGHPVLDVSDERADQLRKRLLFVAANAAYERDQFHRSANFLSVTMAELFRARHFALPAVEERDTTDEHRAWVNRSTLFICGAGACGPDDRRSGLMAKQLHKRHWEVPPDAVGDIAFNLLARDGTPIELPSGGPREFMKRWNPILDLSMLSHIAANQRVVLILDSDPPKLKQQIGAAILRREYATHVVLGAQLGRMILEELKAF